jgi:hypothetical protein
VRFWYVTGNAQGGSEIFHLASPEADFDSKSCAVDQIREKQTESTSRDRQSYIAPDQDPKVCFVMDIAEGASDCFGRTRIDVQSRGHWLTSSASEEVVRALSNFVFDSRLYSFRHDTCDP